VAKTWEEGFDALRDMGDDLGAIMEHYCGDSLISLCRYVSWEESNLRITRMQKIANAERCKSIVLYWFLGFICWVMKKPSRWQAVTGGGMPAGNGSTFGNHPK
jgi:hypothetical protein